MATNTGGGTTASFSNTPQATDDAFRFSEDDLVQVLDVLANDLGGNAKVLWSIDDTTLDGTTGISGTADGTIDLLTKDVVGVSERSDLGARIWLTTDGKIAYDTSGFGFLGAGETRVDHFTYAIRLGNGTLSWATVSVNITGSNDGPDIKLVGNDRAVDSLNETNSRLTTSGTLTVVDPDTTDAVNVCVSSVAVAGTGGAGGLTNAQLLAMLSLTGNINNAADGAPSTLGWLFDSGTQAFNYLAAGQTLTLTYTLTGTDGHGGTDTQSVTVNLTGTNDAAVITETAGDDHAVIEAGGVANATPGDPSASGTLHVSDVDAGQGTFVVAPAASLAGTYGTFTFNEATGAWGYTLDNARTATQALTQGQPATDTLTVHSDDGTAYTVTVNLTGTNDAAAVTTSGTLSYTENQAAAAINPALTISDVDSSTLAGATVSITGNFASGQDVLGFVNQSGITGSYNATTGVLTLTGTATVAQYQAALDSVTYFNSSENPSGATRTIGFQVGDGSVANNLSNVASTTVSVSPVNDAPVNTIPASFATNEDTAVKLSGLSVADVDAGSGAISVSLSVASGSLTAASGGNVTVTGSGTGSLVLSGIQADINAFLASSTSQPTYVPVANANGAVTLTMTTSDGGNSGSGGALGDTDISTINITAVDDAPINTMPGAQAVNEDTTLVFSSGNGNAISISDVDAGSDPVQVTLSVAHGTLTLGSTAGLTVTGGANGTSTVTVQGTQAAINAALQGLAYTGGANFNGSESLSLLTSDLGHNGTGGPLTDSESVAITVNAVNDAPVASGSATLAAINEDTAAPGGATVSSLFSGNFSDSADQVTGGSSANTFNGIAISSYTADASKGSWQYSTDGGSSWTTIASATTTSALTLNATDLLRFVPAANYNGSATALSANLVESGLAITGGGTMDLTGATGGTTHISPGTVSLSETIDAVNDAPVATITPTTYSATEQVTLHLHGTGLSISDVDAGSGSLTVTLSVTAGVITIFTGTTGAGVSNSGTSSVAITGTLAQINDLLAGNGGATVDYFDSSDAPAASATLTMTVHDNGNTGGGDVSSSDTATINITAVNDAPVATIAHTYGVIEQQNLTIHGTGLSISDVDAGSGPMTVTLSVTEGVLNVAAGTSGALVSNSGTSSVTITGSQSQINDLLAGGHSATVVYNDNLDNPSSSVTLSVSVHDNGNTGGGDLSSSATTTIAVAPVNDPPVVSNVSVSASAISFVASDPDNSTLTLTTPFDVAFGNPAISNGGTTTLTPTAQASVISGTLQVTDGSLNAAVVDLLLGTNNAIGDVMTGSGSTPTAMYGFNGNDTLTGGTGADWLFGGNGNDTLVGAQNDVLLDGGVGTDTLQVGVNFTSSSDTQIVNIETVTLTAAATVNLSNQTEGFGINGSAGADSITGGAGGDSIAGGQNDLLLDGGSGFDALIANSSFTSTSDAQVANIELVRLEPANATLNLSNQIEGFQISGDNVGATIIGGSGNDVITADQSSILLNGGGGNDTFLLQGGVTSFTSTSDAQVINIENFTMLSAGTLSLANQTEGFVITGSAFADTITGGSGADSISAGLGNDTIVGAQNDTLLDGGSGNDTLQVGANFASTSDAQIVNIDNVVLTVAATLDLSAQTDGFIITGSSGADTIIGSSTSDNISAGGGDDVIVGGASDGLLDGGTNTTTKGDVLQLNSSFTNISDAQIVNIESVLLTTASTLNLASQSEGFNINGSSGIDTIIGGSNADTINGHAGNDTLTGNGGADQFRFSTVSGNDAVTDFTTASDKIGLLGGGGTGAVAFGHTGASSAGTTLANQDFSSANSISNINSADSNSVVIINTAQTTANITGLAGNNNSTNAYIVVFNSTTNKAEIWFDTNWNDSGNRVQVATLSNITALAGVTGLSASNFVVYDNTLGPAGAAGSAISLGLTNASGLAANVALDISGLPSGWTLNHGVANADGTWTVDYADLADLSATAPASATEAALLTVSQTWTNADGSIGYAAVDDNLVAYASGTPIFAWSGDDTLSGSADADTFVFSQPIGADTVRGFDASHDIVNLIGYSGIGSFADVQAHTADDANGNAVITLADGQSITLDGISASLLTAANFEFNVTPIVNNAGTITIGVGAMLPMSGTVTNSGTITLDADGGTTVLQLIQNGITLQGGGHVVMSDSAGNLITATLPSIAFNNVDNVISGAGDLGGGSMILTNGGTIIADGFNALVIDTGANAVINTGSIEATGPGGLDVIGSVVNDGLILAQSGSITIGGDVTGAGHVEISGDATIEFGGLASNDIALGADATGLIVFDHSDAFSGMISGMNSDDQIDLRDLQFGANATMTYADNGSGEGVLTISDGLHSVQLHLSGNYQIDDFAMGSDGQGGMLLTNDVLNPSASLFG
ncbi:MAG: VCBS domain-containing protein [Sphingomicrobium sp.]